MNTSINHNRTKRTLATVILAIGLLGMGAVGLSLSRQFGTATGGLPSGVLPVVNGTASVLCVDSQILFAGIGSRVWAYTILPGATLEFLGSSPSLYEDTDVMGQLMSLECGGGYVYVGLTSDKYPDGAIQVVNAMSLPELMPMTTVVQPNSAPMPNQMAKDGNVLYVASGQGGLNVYRIGAQGVPTLFTTIQPIGNSGITDVSVANGRIYLAEANVDMAVLQADSLGTQTTGGAASGLLRILTSFGQMAGANGGNPAAQVQLQQLPMHISVIGDTIVVAGTNSIELLNGALGVPVSVGHTGVGENVTGIQRHGDYVYVSYGSPADSSSRATESGIAVFNAHDPANVIEIGGIGIEHVKDIIATDRTLFAAAVDGAWSLSLGDPSMPEPVTRGADMRSWINDVDTDDGG